MKKNTKIYLSIGTVLVVSFFFLPIKITYKVYSTGKVFPVNEWILARTVDGRITESIKNNQLGVISSYGGKEFQKGDVFDFTLYEQVLSKRFINKGEVIASLYSNDLQRQLVELEGQKDVEKALYKVYSTGEKRETIKEAETNLLLAKEQFEIQKKLIKRKEELYRDSLISPQQYEISLNEYEVSKINFLLAETRVGNLTTGQKPEQLKFVEEKISSLEGQINNLKKRRASLEIKAPFSGLIQLKKGGIVTTQEILSNIVDTSSYIIISPIQVKELKNLELGQTVTLKLFNADCQMKGRITHIDNAIQIINGKQAVYVTTSIEEKCPGTLPGIFAQTIVNCGELSPLDYTKRLVVSLFYR